MKFSDTLHKLAVRLTSSMAMISQCELSPVAVVDSDDIWLLNCRHIIASS